ncbi:LysR family transcriptional regulator [Neisseriaceae bacterium TC5R-5]|nr:LysR family transcriptional regulator [Neisseriaceae bacterium TC5R-5]
MRTFMAVAEKLSFSEAAEVLNLTAVSVSRQIAYLERRLGVRLLNRNTRQVSLSSTGATYYEHCVEIVGKFDATEAAISSQALQASGKLRLALPMSLSSTSFAMYLARFQQKFPAILVDASLTDRTVDLVEEGFDLGLRITHEPPPHLIARKLATTYLCLCASPSYLAKHGQPAHPRELHQHRCLSYSHSSDGDNWSLHGKEEKFEIGVQWNFRANSSEMLCSAAKMGMGITRLPIFQIKQDLIDGNLVRVLPDYAGPLMGIWAIYANRSYMSAKVRNFIDHMVGEFSIADHH